MRLSKIEKQPFIFGRYDLVTPVMRFRFVPHISSKDGQRISMIAIAGDHLPTCVAAGEKDCQGESDSAPRIDTRQRSSCSHRPMGGLVWFNTSRRTARRAVAIGMRGAICAASSKQSGGITGKILSTRFDGISDITISPPMLQQSSQKVSGDISRNTERNRQFRDRRPTAAIPIISTLHGANLCNRCGK